MPDPTRPANASPTEPNQPDDYEDEESPEDVAPSTHGLSVVLPEPEDPEDPTRTDEPEAAEPSELEARLTRQLAELEGTWSVYVRKQDTGETVSIHEAAMPSGALIKLFVAGAYYVSDPTLKNQKRSALARKMIRENDAEACNELIDHLTFAKVNHFNNTQGYRASRLYKKLLTGGRKENYTSARECGLVLEAVLEEQYVNPKASGQLLKDLKKHESSSLIPGGLPEGVETADLPGRVDDSLNDAAVVWSPNGVYVICVMADDLPDLKTARQEIRDLSRTVYDYFNS